MERSEHDPDCEPPALDPAGVFDSVGQDLVKSRLAARMFGRDASPRCFGRFELRAAVGKGGMGTVYAAWDPTLEREVALKVVDTASLGPGMVERALREARSLAKLSHPNVVSVFEAGEVQQRVWIAMELLAGETLGAWARREPSPSPRELLEMWLAVARGLWAVHQAGLVHRDVKPANVVVGDDGRPRLIDFGLVRDPAGAGVEGFDPPPEQTTDEPDSGSRVTRGFVGTRAYAAPEQRSGGGVDARADQYALCVSIWEALSGSRPTTTPAPLQLPSVPGVPKRVFRALERGLASDPESRHPSLEPLIETLEGALQRRTRRATVILGSAGAGVVATTLLLERDAPPADPCPRDAAALEGTWDAQRRQQLIDRASPSPSRDRVIEALDQWAERWHASRRAACVATRVDGVQSEVALDQRSACLERKRRSVAAILATITDPQRDIDVAVHAPQLLAELPRLESCDDPLRLAEMQPLPPSGTERDEIESAYDAVAQVRTLALVGDVEGARARAKQLLDQTPEYLPLTIEAEALQWELDIQTEREARAIEPLVSLGRRASAARLDELAATLLVTAAEAATGRWSKPERERSLVEEASAALDRVAQRADPRRISMLAARANLRVEAGDLRGALELDRDALALASSANEALAIDRQRNRVASRLGDLGEFEEARAEYAAVCRDAETRWGPKSPLLAKCEFNLGALAIRVGELETASRHFDRAEAIEQASFGPDSLQIASIRFARAKLAMLRGELETALRAVDQVIEVYERAYGPDHGRLAQVHEGRGVLRFYLGDVEGSVEAYNAALAIQERILGPEHPDLAELYANLAESELALERWEEALRGFDRALALYTETLPEDHPDLALPLKGRGQTLLALDRPREALDDLERSLALAVAGGGESLEIADTRFSLARALAAADPSQRARARAMAAQSRSDYAELEMASQREAVDRWIAALR
ncbi:MAG: tetratricopeptide repeat protein [Nannocystaceae bacterium]|nr:serine/threonine-protein kinase [bacterium]